MYKKILTLLALDEESPRVLDRARALAQTHDADLHILHVVEYVPLAGTEEAMLTAPIDLGPELEQRAKERLAELLAKQGVEAASCRVAVGDLCTELSEAVDRLGIDLAVVGNHPRRGLAAVFNHAQDEVLHRCQCDVLAVQLGR